MARKRGVQYIPYDYEAAYNKAMEDMHEWFIENLFQHRKKVIYALKEITAGDQFEIEIYPQFRSMDEVPPEGRTIKKDNNKAQKNLNDKNARKYVERLINENFSDRDIWMTLTYDDAHLPPDGDVDAAIKNVQKYIRRINYQRKKRGLPNAKYVYVTAYNPDAEIRWHHHIVMDGEMDMDMDTKADKPVVQHRVKTRTPADPATVEIVVMRKTEGSTTYWYDKGQINWVPTDDGVEVEPLLVLTNNIKLAP